MGGSALAPQWEPPGLGSGAGTDARGMTGVQRVAAQEARARLEPGGRDVPIIKPQAWGQKQGQGSRLEAPAGEWGQELGSIRTWATGTSTVRGTWSSFLGALMSHEPGPAGDGCHGGNTGPLRTVSLAPDGGRGVWASACGVCAGALRSRDPGSGAYPIQHRGTGNRSWGL